jgi:hypothetical protein
VLGNLNTTLENSSGTTSASDANYPSSPYIIAGGSIPAGGTISVTLQFAAPGSGSIAYSPEVVSGTSTP